MLLEPPSCGQPPGHRMEGLRAALTDERGSRKTDERTRGQRGKEQEQLSGCGSQCVCGYRLFTVRLSALVGTPIASGSLRQKRQARELFLGCYSLGEYETATTRRGRCGTDMPWRRGRRLTDPQAEAVRGQTGGAGDKQTAAV